MLCIVLLPLLSGINGGWVAVAEVLAFAASPFLLLRGRK